MKFTITIPSKTFLLGEYLALKDGRALLLNTNPKFEISFCINGSGDYQGIHADSPAGKYLQTKSSIFNKVDIQFKDPHQGRGGFGASSAQYIGCYLAGRILEKQKDTLVIKDEVLDLWRNFIEISRDKIGPTPSGTDVMAQVIGGISEVSINPFAVENRRWPFAKSGFLLVSTGNKTVTHDHLRSLKSFNAEILSKAYDAALVGFRKLDYLAFSTGVNGYSDALFSLGFMHEKSKEICQLLKSKAPISAIKGCGAMGSDVLFITFENHHGADVIAAVKEMNLSIAATHEDITLGASIDGDTDFQQSVGLGL